MGEVRGQGQVGRLLSTEESLTAKAKAGVMRMQSIGIGEVYKERNEWLVKASKKSMMIVCSGVRSLGACF